MRFAVVGCVTGWTSRLDGGASGGDVNVRVIDAPKPAAGPVSPSVRGRDRGRAPPPVESHRDDSLEVLLGSGAVGCRLAVGSLSHGQGLFGVLLLRAAGEHLQGGHDDLGLPVPLVPLSRSTQGAHELERSVLHSGYDTFADG